jgi:hypothetical protein
MSSGSGSGGRTSRVVDHTYRDFSLYLQQMGQVDKHKKVEANFPAKLHQMLSDPHFSNIIVWMVRYYRCICQLFHFFEICPHCQPDN